MVVTVPWADYAPEQVERLVSAWLVRTVPGGHRVDGAGGDDGADVRVSVDRGLHVFEIKSFHKRLTAANKSQILRSLATAVKHQTTMFRWTLVLPLDLSPAEIRWFEQTVASTAPILIDWIGRTEIESGLSQHQDLLRSLAPGSVERRALDLAAEYNLAASAVSHTRAAIEVGQGEGDMQAEFQAAYAAAGGNASLGRPVDQVFRIGPGYAQSFPGATSAGPAIMCALPDHAAIVVPSEIWRALNRLGGGTERNGGVSAGGFPVGPLAADGSPIIPSSATVVDLAGGDWIPGQLVRNALGSWSWQAIPRVDHLMHHNTRWTGNEQTFSPGCGGSSWPSRTGSVDGWWACRCLGERVGCGGILGCAPRRRCLAMS